MKVNMEKIICKIIYFTSFFMILMPADYDFRDSRLWIMIFGGLGLYLLGMYEGMRKER